MTNVKGQNSPCVEDCNGILLQKDTMESRLKRPEFYKKDFNCSINDLTIGPATT